MSVLSGNILHNLLILHNLH